MKFIGLICLTLATSALAEDMSVKFSVVEKSSNAPIDWQSGWGMIDVWATSPSGKIVYPSDDIRERNVFVFNEPGRYVFSGRGAYVCGLNSQSVEISSNIVEIRLFGWCE